LKICDFGLARVSNPDDHDKFMTEYVATRWYRPPEVILSWKEYGKAIDMWAVGCIFAELLGRKPLFPGSDYLNQLSLISNVLGTPSQEDIEKIGSAKARDYVLKMPFRKKVPFSKLYPKASTAAIDLLERMLTFDPDKRITVNEALAHPYLASLHDPNDEPTCPQVFDFQFEAQPLGRRDVRALIFEEICNYYPDLRKEENLRQEAEQKNAAARAAAHEPEPEPPAKPIKPEDQPII
jgi:serine/threonine protein kinase